MVIIVLFIIEAVSKMRDVPGSPSVPCATAHILLFSVLPQLTTALGKLGHAVQVEGSENKFSAFLLVLAQSPAVVGLGVIGEG